MKRLACLFLACPLLVAADHAAADTFGSGANTFDIEFVTIGNPGNPADTTGAPNPAGAVPYAYRMGKFEISERMIDKANALGGLGITKDTRSADKPATSTSWNEAARFVNWINLESGSTPAYKFALQPGEVGYNANANIELWTVGDPGYDPHNLYRNSLARYFLPSVHEWYKAAYYDPISGVYYNYPTGSDNVPTAVVSGTAAGTAVYNTLAGPANITLAGGLSPYGTMGQGGNAYEWEETDFDLVNGPTPSSAARGVRYGNSSVSNFLLASLSRTSTVPANVFSNVYGFRVASIPEPGTLLLLCLGSLAVSWRRRVLVCASILAAFVCVATSAQAVTIDMVTIGNPGNAPDTRYNSISAGSVANAYQIGKYEVTAGQYTEFLNAVADADPNGLYHPSMAGFLGANIQRTGSSPNYNYSVAADWANRPVNYVSFWDAARFANWLHNGQPTGPQAPGTTEGGAYHDVGNLTLFGRNSGAKFFIPTFDEWYKAAYHDKTAGLVASYFDYPTGTNSVPGNDISESTNPGNNANFFNDTYAIGSPYYHTLVGEFELSDSPYGTFDQGGNVLEWNETVYSGSFASFHRGLRGGSFDSFSESLLASNPFSSNFPSNQFDYVGFRVASAIPEPNTLLLLGFGSLAVLRRRLAGLTPTRCRKHAQFDQQATVFHAFGKIHAQDVDRRAQFAVDCRHYSGACGLSRASRARACRMPRSVPTRRKLSISARSESVSNPWLLRSISSRIRSSSSRAKESDAIASAFSGVRKSRSMIADSWTTSVDMPLSYRAGKTKTRGSSLSRGLLAFILAFLVCMPTANGAHADTFGSGANTFEIEFVTIGSPNNAADTTGNPNPAGSVPYSYRMGKFEISESVIDKANALGGLGITKNTRNSDKPATSVSWNEAARFVNWLNTSSNSTPAYKFALQPGDAGYSANANIELWTIADAGYNPNNLYRNSLAKYFLPSVHEWYKAAYYDPTSGVYYDYPTGSDSVPTGVASGTAAGTAVYNRQLGPADITLAGGLSPYGTMGQGGNVYEWDETDFDLVNDSSSSARGARGGSWGNVLSFDLLAGFRGDGSPTVEGGDIGFRVASTIPEPSTLLLLLGFAAPHLAYRCRGERRPRRGLHAPRMLVAQRKADAACRLVARSGG